MTEIDSNLKSEADEPDSDRFRSWKSFSTIPSHEYKTLKYGDVMDGVIMRIDRDEILVDIGSKSEGVVPGARILQPDLRGEGRARDRRHRAGLRRPARKPGRPCGRLDRPGPPGEELAPAAGAVRSQRGHRGRGHQLQQGRPAGEPGWRARFRAGLAGHRDSRWRRGQQAGRHGPPDRHQAPRSRSSRSTAIATG